MKSNAPSGRDTLYVVVGVLYESSKTLDGVPCPSHFYKCLMKCSFDSSGTMTAAKGCAYLFTNEAPRRNYSQGLTSIDAVEQRSGWDFANVPKSLCRIMRGKVLSVALVSHKKVFTKKSGFLPAFFLLAQ